MKRLEAAAAVVVAGTALEALPLTLPPPGRDEEVKQEKEEKEMKY